MGKAPKDQDEAKLEKLAKRLLATPPKPREDTAPRLVGRKSRVKTERKRERS